MGSETEIGHQIDQRLRSERDRLVEQWNNSGRASGADGSSTRYLVVDDLLPPALAHQIRRAFPEQAGQWHRRESFRERKLTLAKLTQLEPIVGAVILAFQQPQVIAQVGLITGIQNLQGDPLLYAGGISLMRRGDFLNPHIDNSHDLNRERYRRLNLLFYVSPDWSAGHGGNFELWNPGVSSAHEIVSVFNRLLIMETGPQSWHSVNPVRADQARCCVSNYYFSKQSPTGDDYYHVTSFLGRPEQPFRRLIGRVDNRLRQTFAAGLGITRGRQLINSADP